MHARIIPAFATVLVAISTTALWAAAGGHTIQRVSVAKLAINPSIGESAAITVACLRAGQLSVLVLDRDGYPVRTLAKAKQIAKGDARLTWDGRDDAAQIVPDEAYSLKIDWVSGKNHDSYFPANQPAMMTSVPVKYYDRRGGTLAYDLSAPSRVHLQTGSAVIDPRTKNADGPVMKTVVNREPRVNGAIAEHWNGYDESGTIYIPDLPNFVTSIAATPLPDNSIITIGNHKQTFPQSVAGRPGKSLFTFHVDSHEHHMGLATLDDVSPTLVIEPTNATWSSADRLWHVADVMLSLKVTVAGPSAKAFAAQPGNVYHYINQRIDGTGAPAAQPVTIEVPLAALAPGINNVSVNWMSSYGTVAANSIRVANGAVPPRSVAGGKAGAP